MSKIRHFSGSSLCSDSTLRQLESVTYLVDFPVDYCEMVGTIYLQMQFEGVKPVCYTVLFVFP